jgi:hypothetical protein
MDENGLDFTTTLVHMLSDSRFLKQRTLSTYLFTEESFNSSPNLYAATFKVSKESKGGATMSSSGSSASRLSNINPQQNVIIGFPSTW